MALCRDSANRAAYFRRTSERNLVNVEMLHQCFAGRSIAGDDVYDASGEADLLADMRKSERRQGRELRGLQHDGIPGGERGRNLPCQHE